MNHTARIKEIYDEVIEDKGQGQDQRINEAIIFYCVAEFQLSEEEKVEEFNAVKALL